MSRPGSPAGSTRSDETAQAERLSRVRERLARSALVAGGGAVRTRLLDRSWLAALVDDALAARPDAVEARVEDRDGSPTRGDPDRWLDSAPGGPALQAFATSAIVLETLTRATGVSWQLAGPASWSYYQRPGHHLGLHRDLALCDLAVVTCVVDERPDDREGGLLRVWPSRPRAPLEDLRRDPSGAHDLRLSAGESVLLLGGLLPHQVLPLAPDQVRIVAPVCYQADGPLAA